MVPVSLLIPLVMSVLGVGCGGSSDSSSQPFGPTTVPASRFPPQGFTIEGRKSLTAVGDTSQLRAVVRWADGTSEDVTANASWQSLDPSVVVVSKEGVATAIAFGAARIDARYETLGNSFQIAVTPEGTFAATGEVRQPGQGPISAVLVREPVSGRSTLTDDMGKYSLGEMRSSRLHFQKDGYEPGTLEVTADSTGFMRLQRVVRIAAGETAIEPKLTHMDVWHDVGPDRCSPCRLIRIVVPAAGTMRLELSWEPYSGSDLHLWVDGRRYPGNAEERKAVAETTVGAGEQVVYVGYYQWKAISGSSIKFSLTTSMVR